jgi:hypothetical protein
MTDSSNYFTVAKEDDKKAARFKRIQDAVQRSKTEYRPEHAFTERKWFHDTDRKLDRQRLGKVPE